MTLVGKRIRLLPSDESLSVAVTDYYCRNRTFLQSTEPIHPDEFYTEAYQRQTLTQDIKNRQAKQGYRFYIEPISEPGKVIGTIALNAVVWGAFRSCFLGYKLDEAYLNRGIMTEAVALMVDYAFYELKLHRIEANVMPQNKQSLRVLEKNDFYSEGLAKKYLSINGVWEDHIHMIKLGPDENQ